MTNGINGLAEPSGPGCVECEADQGWWFHLRRCAECGHIGCCDTSPSQHASKHFAESGHPIMYSYEPGEEWFWSFQTNDYYDGPMLLPPTEHPADQTVPGPAERVPANWREQLN